MPKHREDDQSHEARVGENGLPFFQAIFPTGLPECTGLPLRPIERWLKLLPGLSYSARDVTY